jgi:molybdate/tungstate transport system ATP-binding protein
VRLRPSGRERASDGAALAATVDRWLNEGDGYRVVVGVDDAPLSLAATVPPTEFEGLPTAPGSSVRAVVDPDAVHLISPDDGGDGPGREPSSDD